MKVLTVQAVSRVFKNSGWCANFFFFLNVAVTFTNLFCPVNCYHLSSLITLCLNHINSLFLEYHHNILSFYSCTNLILQRKQTHQKKTTPKQKSKKSHTTLKNDLTSVENSRKNIYLRKIYNGKVQNLTI